jgi:hypothetical protein
MQRRRQTTFEERRALVAVFREQIALLSEADPEGVGRLLATFDFGPYDTLIAKGPDARWPAGLLPGLREGIRDCFVILDRTYQGAPRVLAYNRLRAIGGSVLKELESREAKQLGKIRRRGRINSEDEYYLVRAHVDRLEGEQPVNGALLRELWRLLDKASVSAV